MERRDVGILGATGTVGQRFIQLLANHPWFNITWLAASDRSAGKTYAEACTWKLDTPLPAHIGRMTLQPNTPEASATPLPRIIFAALDASIAQDLEPRFAEAGCAVISNSSAFRMAPDVPLVIPEVNADHLVLLEAQTTRRGADGKHTSGGYIVTNPNCSAIGLVLALKPLEQRFGIESLFVSTMQAISGAGYPGVPALDILGNVVPYIKNEEEKLEEECNKLLGTLTGITVTPLPAKLSAHCNRVAVEDGHTECVSIKLKAPPPTSRSSPPGRTSSPSAPPPRSMASSSPPRPCSRLNLSPRPTDRSPASTACAATAWPPLSAACAPAACSTGSSSSSRTTPCAAPPEPPSSTPKSSPSRASLTLSTSLYSTTQTQKTQDSKLNQPSQPR